MDSNYRKTRKTHARGTRSAQPLATDVLEGTLYFVTDEGIIERSNGIIWESFSGSGGGSQGLRGIPGIDGIDGESAEPLIFALQAASAGIPGGSNTQVQFNDSNVFGGDAGLTYNKTTDSLILAGLLDISGAAAGQIKFPATQNPSANANTLDDYERGTWTPADVSGASLTLVNPDTHTGSPFGGYIKIGQMVYLAYGVEYPVTANALQAKVGTLPFTTENNTPAVYWGQTLVFTNSNGIMSSLNANITWMSFYAYPPTPTAQTNVQMSGKYVYGNLQFRATA